MRIAFLGWGSLIWDPRELKVSGSWQKDGPVLPIEFARVSKDGRLTLVLYSDAPDAQVLWASTSCVDLLQAIKSLAEREGTSENNIGFISIPDKGGRCKTVPQVISKIESWAKSKGIDAVVWTDLHANFEKRTKTSFNEDNVIKYLESLESRAWCKAEEYVRRAPEQIRTPIRRKLEERLGWHPRATNLFRILRRERVWPTDWRDQMLMEQAHGRTEIFLYRVKLDCMEPFRYQVPVSSDVVAVVAYDKNGKVYLVRQSRPAWAEKTNGVLVLPGGGVPSDLDDNTLLREAKRELKEETGCDCETTEKLATILCSGRIKSKHHVFLAEIQQQNRPEPEETENIMGLHVELLDLNEAIQKFCNGEEETTGYTLLGLLMAREKLTKK